MPINSLLKIKHYSALQITSENSPVVKKTDGLSSDELIRVVKIMFAEFRLPKKIFSDTGTNFISDKFRQFCRQLNIEQVIIPSYHH